MDEISGLPQERLRNGWNAPHTQSYMIGHPTWVYSATVGDSTVGASIFPRRRGRARHGALRQDFRGVYPNLGGIRIRPYRVPGRRGLPEGAGTKLAPKFRGYPVRQYRCRVADEPGPWVPRHHLVHLTPHPRLNPRAAGCSVWVSLRALYAKTATPRCGQASRRPISKIVRNSVFLQFFKVPARTHTVVLPFLWRTRHADGWG